MPLRMYFAANSAPFPQATQGKKSASCDPSALLRRFTASLYVATGVPLWVVLSSGSAARRPIINTLFMVSPFQEIAV